MADATTRSAARLAAAVAVPVAAVTGLAFFGLFNHAESHRAAPAPSPTRTASARPQATTAVHMDAPALSGADATACRAFLAQLPQVVDGLVRRPVTAGAEQNAAYGDPPILVSCGGPAASYDPTDVVYPGSGVCWDATVTNDASVWTALGRTTVVRVVVPKEYEGPYQWVISYSPAVKVTIPASRDVPSGCQP